jgi:hypothetical protein
MQIGCIYFPFFVVMIEEKLNILEKVMSAVGYDRLNLQFKNEPDHKFNYDINDFGAHQIERVLNYFQLPFHFFDWRNYDQIINNETIVYDDIKAFIKLVKHRSKVYLTNETKSNLKKIKKAIEQHWNFDQLEKELSINLSKENAPYYWFLFHEILSENLMLAEDFLADITLAEELQIVTNISVHRNFVKTFYDQQMDRSKVDGHLLETHYKMTHLYGFIAFKGLEKYQKIIKLIEIL